MPYSAPFTVPDGLSTARVCINVGPLFNPGGTFVYNWWMGGFEIIDAAEVCDGNLPQRNKSGAENM